MRRLFKVALTGGIACGKSSAAQLLASQGAYLICSDQAAHATLAKGKAGWAQVVREFGKRILTKEGEIDRGKLGALVFGDARKRARLEAMVHPRVRRIWRHQLAQCAREGKFRVAIVDIPLLYEVGLAGQFEAVIVVAASRRTQLARLRKRGLSRAAAETRLTAQWPLQKKIDLADYVIWNDGSRRLLQAQTRRIWQEISGAAK